MNKRTSVLIGAVAAVSVVLITVFIVQKAANAPANESGSNKVSSQTTQTKAIGELGTDEGQRKTEQAATIVFTDEGFVPSTITVQKGAVVTVKNNASSRVQFSSDDHPTHRLNTEMNLSVLTPGQSASFTATTIGSHGFHDHIDDSKTGTLLVTE